MEKKVNSTERQKYKRVNILHFSLPVEIRVSTEKEKIPGILLDISPTGLGILSFRSIELNKIVNLRLNLEKIKTETIIAKVAWIKQLGLIYRIGLHFINISAKDFFQIYNFVENFILEDL